MMSQHKERVDMNDIARLLAQDTERIAAYLLPHGRKEGNEWVVGSIHGEEGRSLKVHLSGDKAGIWCDFQDPDKKGDLIDLWSYTKRISKAETVKEAKELLGIADHHVFLGSHTVRHHKDKRSVSRIKLLNTEFHKVLKKRLQDNRAAIEYLKGRGLTAQTIEWYGLGLSKPYKEHDNALVFPVKGRDGQFVSRYGYYNIPGLTTNPLDKNGWMKGGPCVYYADAIGGQKYLFVCEGAKDVWRHWQALKEEGLDKDFLIVSSTHGSAIPDEWKMRKYWAQYEKIFFGHDNDPAGQAMAERLIEFVGEGAFRILVPEGYGKDWTDFWQNGGGAGEFLTLVEQAPMASFRLQRSCEAKSQRSGRFCYDPIDINGAYHNGYMYYPTQTLVRKKGLTHTAEIEWEEYVETVVIRSDRSIHQAVTSKAPLSRGMHQHVLRLTDGTLIRDKPQASDYNTWEWDSIDAYVNSKENIRELGEIVREVIEILKAHIWLPYSEDYMVLGFTVPVTYVQSIFDAVPLILLNGSAATGKTQTGIIMSKLCANGNIIGQVSAAAAARHIDECRGFVVLDDLEAIGSKSGKCDQFNELIQALKVSYNKHSAIKIWIDVKTMKSRRLNFYGVKLINNTLGTDPILGSRMIRIQTRKMPQEAKSLIKEMSAENEIRMRKLRNELHTWAFLKAREVERIYRQHYYNKSNRLEEIAAPLRVMAHLAGNDHMRINLESALARHNKRSVDNDDPIELVREALEDLVVEGYDTMTLSHISMHILTMVEAHFGQERTTDIPDWAKPEWLGRALRSQDLVKPASAGRKRFKGKNLRLVSISDWFIDAIVDKYNQQGKPLNIRTKNPNEFCKSCLDCQYQSICLFS